MDSGPRVHPAAWHRACPRRWRTKLRSAETVAAVVNLARSNREIAAASTQWDRDPYLLGTPGGTVDLRTGDTARARARPTS